MKIQTILRGVEKVGEMVTFPIFKRLLVDDIGQIVYYKFHNDFECVVASIPFDKYKYHTGIIVNN